MSYFISYDFEIPLSSENYREKILDFDIFFIKNAHQYGMMYLVDIEIEQFIQDYMDMRKEYFFRKDYKNYCLLDFGQLSKVFSKNYNPNLSIQFSSLDIYFFKGNQRMEKCVRFFHISSDFTGAQDIENIDFWEENASLSLLFDSKYLYKMPYETKIRYIPRFNSFLREMSKTIKQMGGQMETYGLPEEFMTIEGFLLNGKIIYQEDLDEGREPFPVSPPPFIPYWLEREIQS